MDNVNLLDKINNLVLKNELTFEEILFVLENPIIERNTYINIDLLNKWLRNKYNYYSNVHENFEFLGVDFRDITFDNIDFREVTFKDCRFYSCEFRCSCFANSKLQNTLFLNCVFPDTNMRDSDIQDCKFEGICGAGDLILYQSKIKNTFMSLENLKSPFGIDFTGSVIDNLIITVASISKEVYSGNVGIRSVDPFGLDYNELISNNQLYRLIFKYCTINNLRLINLNIYEFNADYAIITNSHFINTEILNNISIIGVILNNLKAKKEIFNALRDSAKKIIKENKISIRTKVQVNNKNEAIYKTILEVRDNFKKINDSKARDEFFVLAKEFERKVLKRKKVRLLLMKYWTKYGKSPIRMLINMCVFIVICAMISTFLNFCNLTNESIVNQFIQYLFFSIITFSNIGQVDAESINMIGKILFSVEKLIGILSIGTFMVIFTNKIFGD